MSLIDIFQMAFHNLWQRKLRTTLNLIGVVIGNTILLLALAGTSGVRTAVHALFDASEVARIVYITPSRFGFGMPMVEDPTDPRIVVSAAMSEDRRKRIEAALKDKRMMERSVKIAKLPRPPPKPLDWTSLESLSDLEHVVSVMPLHRQPCRVSHEDLSLFSELVSADIRSSIFSKRLLAGTMLSETDSHGILIDEFLAYKLGFESDSQLQEILGLELSIDVHVGNSKSFRGSMHVGSVESLGPSITYQKIVRGIIRIGTEESELMAFLNQSSSEFGAPGVFVLPGVAMNVASDLTPDFKGVDAATLLVDKTINLGIITKQLKERGISSISSLEVISNVDLQLDQSLWILLGISGSVFFIASIGISNTLMISVLERTPEFGILKSIGAKDSQLVWLMLCEGAIQGGLGALVAVVFAKGAASLGNRFLEKFLETRFRISLDGEMFQFSLAALFTVFCCSTIICTLASMLPAWRAARLDPVVAMRRT